MQSIRFLSEARLGAVENIFDREQSRELLGRLVQEER